MINLNATGFARAIIAAFPNRWAVTVNALAELVDGMRNGDDDDVDKAYGLSAEAYN